MKFLFGLLLVVLSLAALTYATKPAACLQPPAFNGENPCRGFDELWTYKPAKDKCVKFIYGGCDGNDNAFETKKQCEDLCKK